MRELVERRRLADSDVAGEGDMVALEAGNTCSLLSNFFLFISVPLFPPLLPPSLPIWLYFPFSIFMLRGNSILFLKKISSRRQVQHRNKMDKFKTRRDEKVRKKRNSEPTALPSPFGLAQPSPRALADRFVFLFNLLISPPLRSNYPLPPPPLSSFPKFYYSLQSALTHVIYGPSNLNGGTCWLDSLLGLVSSPTSPSPSLPSLVFFSTKGGYLTFLL